MPRNSRALVAASALLLANVPSQAQIVNGSFEVDPGSFCTMTGWTGGCKLGGTGTVPVPYPPGYVNVQPIGKDGSASAGVHGGEQVKQSVTVDGGAPHTLSYYAMYMGLAEVTLRTRVIDGLGNVIAEQTQTLPHGGPGGLGYQKYSLDVPAITADGSLTVEFAGLGPQTSNVASVDVVSLDRVLSKLPPVLDPPKLVGGVWKLAWTETVAKQKLLGAADLGGPWTVLDSSAAVAKGGKLYLDIAADPNANSVYFRTHAGP